MQLLFFISNAQATIPEKFIVHHDRPCYLTGETIRYKLYNTNYTEHSDHSEIVYVNVHEKNGNLLLQQKLKLSEGRANGSIDIPLSWNEDHYYISCFTKWNLQFGKDGLVIKKIPIYNFFKNENNSTNPSLTQGESIQISGLENIKLELSKKSYRRREKVSVKIFPTNGQRGNCSVSIHSLVGLNDQNQNEIFSSPLAYEVEAQYAKEKGLIIEGIAMDSDSKALVTSDVLSIYKVGDNNFSRIIAKDGLVRVGIEDFYGTEKFQLFNMNPYQSSSPDFDMKRIGKKLLGIENTADMPIRNESINAYINNAKLRRKIQEIFEERTWDSLQSTLFNPIPFKADKVYHMEKYQSMKTLEEFLKEIVIYADLKTKDGKTTVRLKNTGTQHFFMEKPWYLVDGYLTRDEGLVLAIPFKNLIRVEIFNTNKSILGQLETVMIRSGVIAVYTDNYYLRDHFEANKNIFDFKGYSTSRYFVGIEQTSSSEARENPNFESLLYWNPNVDLTDNKQVDFVTSDLIGNFIIRVEGITESGQKLSGSKIFSVNN